MFTAATLAAITVGCDFSRWPDPDIPLEGGYVLGSYESVSDDGYFVARGDKVVVSSSAREVGVVDGKIVGRVEDAMVGTMERIADGYFILDTRDGTLSAGLSKTALEDAVGTEVTKSLVLARDWKQ